METTHEMLDLRYMKLCIVNDNEYTYKFYLNHYFFDEPLKYGDGAKC
jgi:hypothetical protein